MSVLLVGLVACGETTTSPDGTGTGVEPQDPPTGQSDFVSADGRNGEATQESDRNAAPGAADEDGFSGGGERTVEEGDIYRVLSDSKILNLNSYRGLQIIDFADVTDPEVIGRVRVTGSPVELYAVDGRAYVLLNNWRSYYGNREDIAVEEVQGGLVMAVDIRDPSNPVVTGQARVPGWIRTSRLTSGGGGVALYVVSNDYDGDSQTRVRSFGLTAEGKLIERSSIDLGGYVQDIQATTEALLVARHDYSNDNGRTTVALVDISNPDGTMVEGAQVRLSGIINNKTNMNLYNGILRTASGNSWGSSGNTNHVETFDVSDMHNPVAIDHDTFGAGESLFATLFLGNKAFFVTYRRVDPFHAFSIDDEGNAVEMAEYVISGWNDYFRPVFDDDRLIGIGVNDEGSRTMAVSLYDITDLSNPDPFITRAEVEADSSWSEARWDDRAFSVLQDAVEVEAGDTLETGLVLLPFSGYSQEEERYISAVQIFTFSENTLTRRGVMRHGTPVRRSFLGNETTTANLSEAELSLFDHTTPDEPVELGRVDLAPNVSDFLVYGDYGVRFHSNSDWYWWYSDTHLSPDELHIISLDDDPDIARAVAVVEVPSRSRIYKVGSLLVAVSLEYVEVDEEWEYQAFIQVFDLSDPTNPELAGTLITDRVQPSYSYYGGYYGDGDCFDCGRGGYYSQAEAYALESALVFVQRMPHNELEGVEEVCSTYPTDRYSYDCWNEEDGSYDSCEYNSGSIRCRSLDGGPEACTGAIYHCEMDDEGEVTCEEVDPSDVPTEENCYDYERYRYWQHFAFDTLDLSDPSNPTVITRFEFGDREEAVGIVADGDTLHANYKIAAALEGDARPYVRYYVRDIDLTVPDHPRLSTNINIPGELIAVDDDTFFTKDFIWGTEIVETALNRLRVFEGRAYLQARREFPDEIVNNVVLDGNDHMLVSKQLAYHIVSRDPSFDWNEWHTDLVILDLDSDDLAVLSESEVDRWASLREARLGRALFSVPGGLLVLNTSNPSRPFAQAYFPTMGWPTRILAHDRDIFMAAGRYGMYRFSLDSFNLLSAPL